MNKCNERKLYLKELYFNIGKILTEENVKYFQKYINYNYLYDNFKSLKKLKDSYYLYNDSGLVFFDSLCRMIIKENFYGKRVFCTYCPYSKKNIILQLFVPQDSFLITNISDLSKNPDKNMYISSVDFEKRDFYFSAAYEFFEKSEKIISE